MLIGGPGGPRGRCQRFRAGAGVFPSASGLRGTGLGLRRLRVALEWKAAQMRLLLVHCLRRGPKRWAPA